MNKATRIIALALTLACSLWSLHSQAATVPVATTDDLSAKVMSAAAGDVLVLADGTYSIASDVIIDKALTITAAADAHPVFEGRMVQFKANTTWEKVDFRFNTNNGTADTNSLRVTGANVTVHIQDCTVGAIDGGMNNYNFVQIGDGSAGPSALVMDRVKVEWAHCGNATNGIFNVTDFLGSSLTFNDCTINAPSAAGKTFIIQGPVGTGAIPDMSLRPKLTLNRCTVNAVAPIIFMVWQGGVVNINQSTVKGDSNSTVKFGAMFRMAAGTLNIDRSVLDSRARVNNTLADIYDVTAPYTPVVTSTINATNSAFLGTSANQRVGGGFGMTATVGGTKSFTHCNFVDSCTTQTGTAQFLRFSCGAAGTPGTLTVQNCLFDSVSTGVGYKAQAVLEVAGGTATPTYVAGTNLLPQAAVAEEKLAGTVLVGDANVAADGIHLQAGSPAIDAAADLSFTVDIDGEARPYGSKSDLGADEFVPPPNAARFWSIY